MVSGTLWGYGGVWSGTATLQSGKPQAGLRARGGRGAGVRLHGPGLDEMLVRLRKMLGFRPVSFNRRICVLILVGVPHLTANFGSDGPVLSAFAYVSARGAEDSR